MTVFSVLIDRSRTVGKLRFWGALLLHNSTASKKQTAIVAEIGGGPTRACRRRRRRASSLDLTAVNQLRMFSCPLKQTQTVDRSMKQGRQFRLMAF